MLGITQVIIGSICDELGIRRGDRLLRVNGTEVDDALQARFLLAEDELLLEVATARGELWECEIRQDGSDELGLVFPEPEPCHCGNNCIFCFVHQLPAGMRPTLYVKDEDYRFSFLYGSYVTLSNIRECDIERILAYRYSPLYVSVHTTDCELRSRLLGRQVPDLMPLLRRLVDGGITLHTQVVVCPGWNDGEQLERTIRELSVLRPGIASLALVPVGLTGHRRGLPDLRGPSREESAAVITMVRRFQRRFRGENGCRWVFAADEWYLRAGERIPGVAAYEDFPQLENGVGLIAAFRRQARSVLRRTRVLPKLAVTTVTGRSFAPELAAFIEALGVRCGVDIRLRVIENRFFGGEVSVAGLLCGRDLLEQLRDVSLGEALLIPDIMLRDGAGLLLDDCSLADLERELGVPVCRIDATPAGLWEGLKRLADSNVGKG